MPETSNQPDQPTSGSVTSAARSIRLIDLACRVGGGANAFRLGPLNLELAAGSRTALVGPSGSGKTTTLRAIAGLETPVAGTVVLGDTVVHEGVRERVPAARRGVGLVFQSGALWPHMDAVRHLRFSAPKLTAKDAVELLERVGLGARLRHRPAQLSGGEAQRLALARALATRPDLLLLDEPLHSVDVHLRDELAALIRRVADELALTLVVVTHDRDEALAIADDVAVLQAGRLVETGPALDLLRAPSSAWTARFLCQAATLPTTPGTNDTLQTAFGSVPAPTTAGRHDLVLLPGDAALDPEGPARGRVVRIEPSFESTHLVHVEVDGKTVRSLLPHDAVLPRPGEMVRLALRAEPRLLPAEEPTPN